jgi:hypothetical protein
MTVAVGTPMVYLDKFEHRWFDCYKRYSYEPKECIITSEKEELLKEIKKQYPFTHTINFNFQRPSWTNERVFAIAEGRDQLRKYICENKNIEWLLMVDSDVETPKDTIEKLLSIAKQGYDLILSRKVGLILLAHRDVCESVKWFTCVCSRDHSIYLEETYQIEKQIREYNDWRERVLNLPPLFKICVFEARWARHKDQPVGVY